MSVAGTAEQSATAGEGGLLAVRLWLWALALLVAAMVLVGGAVRLTDSGLSITEWQPILGILPPMSEADWLAAFEKYKQIPEYSVVNRGMTLDAFKGIYWWEWAHRFLGRMVGFAVALPFLFFWWTGRLPRPLTWRILGIFALGGLQGLLGWYMVMSGLTERVDVSQYRLAAHLALAVAIFAALVWTALGLGARRPGPGGRAPGALIASAAGLALLVFGQMILGAFVAGLRAGLAYNTWPLMDGTLVPDGLFTMTPTWRNLFENALTVQFDHRMAAYGLAFWAGLHVLAVWRAQAAARTGAGSGGGMQGALTGAGLLALALVGQIGLGIATLLAHVPLALGVAHQAGALLVLALALWHLHGLLGRPGILRERAATA